MTVRWPHLARSGRLILAQTGHSPPEKWPSNLTFKTKIAALRNQKNSVATLGRKTLTSASELCEIDHLEGSSTQEFQCRRSKDVMGTIVALIFFGLFLFGCLRAPGPAISLAGLIIFAFGLMPLAIITDLHPYFLLTVFQSVSTMPAIPIGIGLMGLGRLVLLAERRAKQRT